jgi:membrane associated rhomboid family serine protease
MTPDLLLLLAASLVAVQMVSIILRREHVDDAPYLALLGVDLALLVWVHLTGRYESLPAFVGEGIAAVLTLAPRFLDGLERRALARDRFDQAARIAVVRELIMPGRTAARRRRQLADLAQTREGGGLAVARRLRAELAATDDPLRASLLREELATVLFFDRRFAEGIEEVERHLDPTELARRPAFAAYLVRAYGELGRLDRAAQLLVLLEEGPAGPALLPIVAQARLTFLAFAGQTAHVEALLASPPGVYLSPGSKEFLLDTARARAGRPLDPEVTRVIEETFRRAGLPEPARRRRAPATLALLIANTVVFAILVKMSPHAGDAMSELKADVLVRAGALFRPAIDAGEWWRPFTAMFLHGFFWHFAFNLYGLFLLGRFTEDVFGSVRFLAVYFLAGLVGAAASMLINPGVSVGASGAIMGLLGAIIVILVLRRGTWPEAWRRALLGNLVLLGALQIYIGFQVANIDNAAHVGGMLGGALATVALAPGGLVGSGRRGTVVAAVIASALGALLVVGAVETVLTPLERTIDRLGTRSVEVGGTTLTVPATWEVDREQGTVDDRYLGLSVLPVVSDGGVRLEAVRPEPTDGGVRLQRDPETDARHRALFDRIQRSARR